jgi:hypothetical protein
MTIQILIGIFLGLCAAVIGAALLSDFIVFAYKRGYDQGTKDAADWWTQAAKDVEEMKQEIGREETGGGEKVVTRFEDWFRRAFPEQAPSLLNTHHPAVIIIEAAYRDGATEEQIRIMAAATRLAMNGAQVTGERLDYFVTLQQLGNLLKGDPTSSPSPRCTPSAPPRSNPPRSL